MYFHGSEYTMVQFCNVNGFGYQFRIVRHSILFSCARSVSSVKAHFVYYFAPKTHAIGWLESGNIPYSCLCWKMNYSSGDSTDTLYYSGLIQRSVRLSRLSSIAGGTHN